MPIKTRFYLWLDSQLIVDTVYTLYLNSYQPPLKITFSCDIPTQCDLVTAPLALVLLTFQIPLFFVCLEFVVTVLSLEFPSIIVSVVF
jgi:hypothetical protein